MMQTMESLAPPTPEADMAVTYRFGPYMLDVAHRHLVSRSEVHPIPEKLFQILILLLEANCRIVEKSVFFDRLWLPTATSDANLTQHVFMLRRLLGQRGGDQVYIVTVPGKGYRFAVPIEAKRGLAMKGCCERCRCPLPASDEAYICSYECTFCTACSRACQWRCPNCGGEQVRRPRR
jgi:DNA-binding winged helix-turn-helix (wHTH) protein